MAELRTADLELRLAGRIPPAKQFLKWVGNKSRYAARIADCAPNEYKCYIEPFVGSGSVLAAMAPYEGVAGDVLGPLVEIWELLKRDPELLLSHYTRTWAAYVANPQDEYLRVRERYNAGPNAPDLLFLCRACYGGVVRFTRSGSMSTPVGSHRAISPDSLAERMRVWRERVAYTEFINADFEETMERAGPRDVVYCDPPYVCSQAILYGSQDFLLDRLWGAIGRCKDKGAKVLLSIDGMKKSGKVQVVLTPPEGLFEREVWIDCGRSMLRRFQKRGEDMTGERVHDRLLLTW